MNRDLIHYGIHFILPLIVAVVFFRGKWKRPFLIMIAAMLIDLDHLLASPIFDPNRCSINFHPLHGYIAIGFYIVGLFIKKFRILSIGLLIHMIADGADCLLM